MDAEPKTSNTETNVKQTVPFFMVADMEASLRFYVEGLGFTMTKKWIPDSKIEWAWLELGGVALMLQEYRPGKLPPTNEAKASPSASSARTPSPSTAMP